MPIEIFLGACLLKCNVVCYEHWDDARLITSFGEAFVPVEIALLQAWNRSLHFCYSNIFDIPNASERVFTPILNIAMQVTADLELPHKLSIPFKQNF